MSLLTFLLLFKLYRHFFFILSSYLSLIYTFYFNWTRYERYCCHFVREERNYIKSGIIKSHWNHGLQKSRNLDSNLAEKIYSIFIKIQKAVAEQTKKKVFHMHNIEIIKYLKKWPFLLAQEMEFSAEATIWNCFELI